MQIVIDIPQKEYVRTLKGEWNCTIINKAVANGTPLPRCKDCKYFEYDSVAKVDGIPLIVAHEICSKWGNGCKTREDGYCFLFEPKESEDSDAVSD